MRREIAEELVAGWHKNDWLSVALKRGIFCAGDIPTYELINQELGVFFRTKNATVRRFLGLKYSLVSDMLWDGRPDELAVKMLITTRPDEKTRLVFGDKGARTESKRGSQIRTIRARSLGKKTDWKTVK